MAKLAVERSDLVLRLSPLEKLSTLRGDVRVLLTAVRSISVEAHPWQAEDVDKMGDTFKTSSLDKPNLIMVGRNLIGETKVFTAVYGRRPAVRVDLDDASPFSRLIVTARDPESVVAAIRAAARLTS
jgi:hypothetical protein